MQHHSGLRVVFAGTPAFAARHLQALTDSEADSGHIVAGVFTQPDRPAGRGKKLSASPVKQLAQQLGLPVYQPRTFKSEEARQQLAALRADVMVVVAYGLLLPQAVLDTPRLGCVNVHASLLPRWRGAAPVQRAIAAGDSATGVTIMQMNAGLDTGPMLMQERCEIGATDTGETLLEHLATIGCRTLLASLRQLAEGRAQAQPQDDELATYADKIDKAEALVDWRKPALEIDRLIRAFVPFPVAYTVFGEQPGERFGEQRIKIYRATIDTSGTADVAPGTIVAVDADQGLVTVKCADNALSLLDIQLPGKKMMPVKAVLLGNRTLFSVGARFALPDLSSSVADHA